MNGTRKLIQGKKPIITVEVLLSEREYHRLKSMSFLTAEGTVRNVIRGMLRLPPRPIGMGTARAGYIIVNEQQYARAK